MKPKKIINDKPITVNPLLTNEKRPREEYKKWTAGRRKLVLIDSKLVWRGITYDPKYASMLVNYFSKPVYREIKDRKTWLKTIKVKDYPTIEEFRVIHKIPKTTWDNWVRDYPEIREALSILDDMKKHALVVNWLNGNYNAQFAKFVGMNDLGMAEKTETKDTSSITDDQRKSMVREYMRDLKDGEILDVNTESDDA